MSPAAIAAGLRRLEEENARLRSASLAELVRTSSNAARELRDLLRSDGPDFRVALWDMDPYGQQNDGRYEPAPVCTSIIGRRLGWVAYAAKPRTTARGVRIPVGWACWANVDGWPYPQPCASQADGIRLVTEALTADGWTVHPLAPTSTANADSGADPAAGVGASTSRSTT